MELQDLILEITGARSKSVYVVASDELFFLDRLIQAVDEKLLPPEQKDFNQTVLFGKETQARAVIELAKEFPFMGEKRVVVVKEAQEIKDWEPLVAYAKQPLASTLLLLCFSKKPDGRQSWVKQLKDLDCFHEFKPLLDYQLPAFVKNMAKEIGVSLEEESLALLIEFIGNDPGTLYKELEKLKLVSAKGEKINTDTISKYIGISKEYNVFELQKAINQKDAAKMMRIAMNMSQHVKSNPLLATIGALSNHFQRIWFVKVYTRMPDDELARIMKLSFKGFLKEYREAAGLYSLHGIEEAFHTLRDYDLKAKGMGAQNASERDLYVELTYKLTRCN